MTKWKHVFGNFDKFIENYSFKSSWVSVSTLHVWIWGVSPILPCRFAQALSSWMRRIGEQQYSSLSTDFQWDSSLTFGWATQGRSHYCSEAIPVLLWLHASGHCPVGTLIFTAVQGLLHSEAGSPQGFAFIWFHLLFPLSLQVSQFLPLKSIPRA